MATVHIKFGILQKGHKKPRQICADFSTQMFALVIISAKRREMMRRRKNAPRKFQTPRRRLTLLKAAVAWAAFTQKDRELASCVAQLDNLRREHRPEFEAIRRAGAVLKAAWERKIEALRASQRDARKQASDAKAELANIRNQRIELTRHTAITESDRDMAKAALNRMDDARRHLRQEGLIASDETGKEAQARWERLTGDIDQELASLKSRAVELKRDVTDSVSDLQSSEIEVAAQLPALHAELAEQDQEVVTARAQTANAKEKYDMAVAQRPDPRDFKQGTDTNDALFERPVTSEKCEALVVAIGRRLETISVNLRTIDENRRRIQLTLERVTARRPLYQSLLARVKRDQCPPMPPHEKFSDEDTSNQALVDAVCRRFDDLVQALRSVEGSMRRRFDKEMHPLVVDERFAKKNIPFRVRLQRLTFEDYAAEGDLHARAIDDQVRVSQAELDSQDQEKRILVQKLDALARQTVNLLEQAARVSELPETMGVWGRQPFLRISIPRKNDPNERQILIGQAVERWFQPGQNIPQGFALAYESLIALCGSKTINVRILKPEYQLRAVSHDIMDLVTKFSDGEKLTAAIVLYCILVRLRSRLKARAEQLLDGDAGLLLLDNPFGKATLATFVDLQLKMARMMGVQLVYATGINDFSALKHFPHYVRLRNSSRGKATNDYHVTTDPRPLEESISAVTLGFAKNGK